SGGPREWAPQLHVPPLVVAGPGLGPDVAEHHVDLGSLGRYGMKCVELDDAAIHVMAERGRHGHGTSFAVEIRHDGVGESLLHTLRESRAGRHQLTRSSSNTSGSRPVSPSAHRYTRRGSISITARSKNSGSATRFPRKKSMAGSFLRHRGSAVCSHPECRSSSM